MAKLTSEYFKDNPTRTAGDFTYGKPRVIPTIGGARLEIGRFCSIGSDVTIILGDYHRDDWVTTYPFPVLWEEAMGIKGHPSSRGDVIIGNDVWICTGATILSGVRIGDGAVIGAGAVVGSDVGAYQVVVGNPAQAVRMRFDWAECRELLMIRWWDWSIEKIKANMGLLCSTDITEFINKHRVGGIE